MDLKVKFTGRDALVRDILSICGPDGRRDLYSVGAKALQIHVQKYIRQDARSRHATATRLGARPTGHLTKGARAVTWYANETYGLVEVNIPGIKRAFQNLYIRPKNASSLTVPARGEAYGRRADEMESLGWQLFSRRFGNRAILFGRKDKTVRALYYLVPHVYQKQDRTLLPSDKSVADATNLAMAKEIVRVCRKVCSIV